MSAWNWPEMEDRCTIESLGDNSESGGGKPSQGQQTRRYICLCTSCGKRNILRYVSKLIPG